MVHGSVAMTAPLPWFVRITGLLTKLLYFFWIEHCTIEHCEFLLPTLPTCLQSGFSFMALMARWNHWVVLIYHWNPCQNLWGSRRSCDSNKNIHFHLWYSSEKNQMLLSLLYQWITKGWISTWCLSKWPNEHHFKTAYSCFPWMCPFFSWTYINATVAGGFSKNTPPGYVNM